MKTYFISFILMASACSTREEQAEPHHLKSAVSEIHSSKDLHVTGTVNFKEENHTLYISGDVAGLNPNMKHGFHIHENGICEGPDYKSAGNHFNPTRNKHGDPNQVRKHQGDLGNLDADRNGKAHYSLVLKDVGLEAVSGKSLVIHSAEDDLKSNPSGNSGARIACGLIKPVQYE